VVILLERYQAASSRTSLASIHYLPPKKDRYLKPTRFPLNISLYIIWSLLQQASVPLLHIFRDSIYAGKHNKLCIICTCTQISQLEDVRSFGFSGIVRDWNKRFFGTMFSFFFSVRQIFGCDTHTHLHIDLPSYIGVCIIAIIIITNDIFTTRHWKRYPPSGSKIKILWEEFSEN
jgi:hypothetical protein